MERPITNWNGSKFQLIIRTILRKMSLAPARGGNGRADVEEVAAVIRAAPPGKP
jgi:hypothetical protein